MGQLGYTVTRPSWSAFLQPYPIKQVASGEEHPENSPRVLRCAVPTPLRKSLDYLPPTDHAEAQLQPGVRLQVPLGRRMLTAVLLDTHHTPAVTLKRLRCAEQVLDSTPLLDQTQLALMSWVANYYLHPIGEVFALAMSPCERRGEPPAASGTAGIELSLRGQGLPVDALNRAPKQAALLRLLQQKAVPNAVIEASGISKAVIREMLAKSLVERCEISPDQPWQVRSGLTLNSEQAQAVSEVQMALGSYSAHLLEGVTGSGKTEVYLQAIAACIARGEQALVLLPEIGLTPQMVERFRQRFDAPIVLLHSRLSDRERDRSWSAARKGEAAVVIGTRSSVFCPLAQPGLFIVDEEHDNAYAQQDGLRYSARDVAVKRAQLSHCPVLLGSATPSLETLDNAIRGRYQHHKLAQRAGGAAQPTVDILDIRGLALHGGISQTLQQAITDTLNRSEQVLLFINRRGFAPSLLCHDCGWVADCQNCDARMTVHRQPASLRCHHCTARKPLPHQCPDCQGRRLVSAGLGTEQVEQALVSSFPSTPIYRVDSDSMTQKGAMQTLRDALETAQGVLMVGTQMLSKGHDFPRVTLVGVLDADSMLFNPDFRGEERLLQLLTQVGGRAGRAQIAGKVMIQTRQPDHPLITQVLRTDYQILARQLLALRAQQGLPPHGAVAAIRCDSRQLNEGLSFLQRISALPVVQTTSQHCRVIGPLPAAMARRAGLYRSQLIVMAKTRTDLAHRIRALVEHADSLKKPAGLAWFVDIDPVEPF